MDRAVSVYDRVFGIVELFDLILEFCDAFTILSCLSASHHWRNHILNSKPLRRHLSTLQPPALVPETVATTGRAGGKYRLSTLSFNGDDKLKPWCLRHPSLHGILWILRIPLSNLETSLLIPNSPRKPLLHLTSSTATKSLVSDRRAWKPALWTSSSDHRYIYGHALPDLEWRSIATGRLICRTQTKQHPWYYNTLREYLALFYTDEFKALTGESLRRGWRNWGDGRCTQWPWAACGDCQGRFWDDECPLKAVICRHGHGEMCKKCASERNEATGNSVGGEIATKADG